MPNLQFNKTEDDVLDILKKIEDRLLIVKQSDGTARMYFDYDKDNRLEIKPTTIIYHSNVPLNPNSSNIAIVDMRNLTIFGEKEGMNVDTIYVGSLISDGSNIGIISKVETTTDSKLATIYFIYSTKTITWNNYF